MQRGYILFLLSRVCAIFATPATSTYPVFGKQSSFPNTIFRHLFWVVRGLGMLLLPLSLVLLLFPAFWSFSSGQCRIVATGVRSTGRRKMHGRRRSRGGSCRVRGGPRRRVCLRRRLRCLSSRWGWSFLSRRRGLLRKGRRPVHGSQYVWKLEV